ncbi:MAG TPA: helix-turn-helix domain-containing protein [Thermoanaerobaculia bacterium]|nr:helix-turn-helix domain-containing protein [Thermoanaerobaculia bacterium]
MGRPAVRPTDTGALADFFREASIRLGIPQERLTTVVRASRDLSNDEFQVVVSLLDIANAGTPMKKRSSLSQGIVSAIKTVQEAKNDPLAEVDDPMSPAEAVEALLWAESEMQANREFLLKDSMSAAEAAALIGRSRQSIERLRRDDRLLALRVGSQWRYPHWQFEPDAPGGVLPGLKDVIRNLHLSPAGAAFWLLKPAERLGGIPPIELLRRHRPEPVVQLAWDQGFMP